MIAAIIDWSVRNRFMVLLLTVILIGWGAYAVKHTPLDAIPDLSDVQVIIKTTFPGQAPQVVEDQVTYPLTTAMLSVPKATTVRDGTDPYWARSRVLEYLSQVASKLPPDARPQLGPDATGVGWVYEYALVDRTGQVPQVRIADRARGVRSGHHRWHGQAVPGGAGSRQPACLWPDPGAGEEGHSARQPGDRRFGAGAGRGRVYGARHRLCGLPRGSAPHPPGREPTGHADPAQRRHHPGRQGEAGRVAQGPARGRGDRRDL